MYITYRRTGGVFTLLTFSAVTLAATALSVAVATTVLVAAFALGAIALVARAVRTRRLVGTVGAVLMIGMADSGAVAELAARSQSETPSQVSLDKALVSEFRRRVDDYMKLHVKLQAQGTRPKERHDVGENLVSQSALAMRIRFARHNARPGDIFTLPIAKALRRAMDPQLRGLGALRTRESIREDAPELFVLVVNGDYPAGASVSTMPENVLKILPPLPDGLRYRIVDTHLVLMDLDANIVVDYVLDVMCKTC